MGYNPNEPRDERGRWSEGGSGEGRHPTGDATSDAAANSFAHTVKVGDTVSFKYDVEQSGSVTKIENAQSGEGRVFHVIATKGAYVSPKGGSLVVLGEDEIWKPPGGRR
jgi:hypothetical protein